NAQYWDLNAELNNRMNEVSAGLRFLEPPKEPPKGIFGALSQQIIHGLHHTADSEEPKEILGELFKETALPMAPPPDWMYRDAERTQLIKSHEFVSRLATAAFTPFIEAIENLSESAKEFVGPLESEAIENHMSNDQEIVNRKIWSQFNAQ